MSDSLAPSDESIVDDIDADPDYNCSDDFLKNDVSDSNADEIDFDNFDNWHDVSLEPIPKRKTKSLLWNYFGLLKKGNQIFPPTSKKYFCRPCFDNHIFKR